MSSDTLLRRGEVDAPRLRGVKLQALAMILPLAGLAAAIAFCGAVWAGSEMPVLSAAVALAVAFAGGTAIIIGLEATAYPHARLGLCNRVTLLRAGLIAALAGLLPVAGALDDPPGLGWAVFGLALLAVALDGVDGWAARRSGLESVFGARFDMETDVALALVVGLLAWLMGKVGIWFLALGLMRPAFVLAGLWLPALRHPLPEAQRRKIVAAVQMAVQVALLAPLVAPPASYWLGATGLAIVALSFAIDIRWQLRQAKGAA